MITSRIVAMLSFVLTSIGALHSMHAQDRSVPTQSRPTLPEDRARYGAFGHFALTSHNTDFLRMPNTVSCCTGFTGGTGMGLGGGLLAEFPLASQVHIGARIALLTQPFTITSDEPTRLIVNGVGQDGVFEHRLTGSYTTLGFEPLVGVRVASALSVHAGVRVAFPIGGTYEQSEVIAQPATSGTFLNANGTDSQKRTRNEFAGALPNTFIQISPMLGVSYDLPLNDASTIILAPEAFVQLGIMNVIKDSSWKASSFRIGVTLKWSPEKSYEQIQVEPIQKDTTTIVEAPDPVHTDTTSIGVLPDSDQKDTVTIVVVPDLMPKDTVAVVPEQPEPPPVRGTLRVTGLDSDGRELPVEKLTVDEYASTLITPLLPYVFFEENSADLPARYKILGAGEARVFDIESVNSAEKLSTYSEMLNIVGKRLQMHPDAAIVITGNNQNKGAEQNNVALSLKRAEAIKQYLTDVWHIDGSRIETRARLLPSKPSNATTTDGLGENRRAELQSEDVRILAPLVTLDTLITTTPASLRFQLNVPAGIDVASWQLSIRQDYRLLKRIDGQDSPPASVIWDLAKEIGTTPRGGEPLSAQFTVVDRNGVSTRWDVSVDVAQRTINSKKRMNVEDITVDRFSILFDVRSSELDSEDEYALQIIGRLIKKSSTVTITGYTDRRGDQKQNQTLGKNRVSAVAGALQTRNAITKGVGHADLFDSTLPEGRLYTRTVNVVIETPVANK